MTKEHLALLLSMFAYQALQLYRKGELRLPKGYKRIAVLESPSFRRMGYAAESPARLIIAFRGTGELEDLRKSVSFTQIKYPYSPKAGRTHKGFTRLYGTLRPVLWQALRGRRVSKPVYITGHSLGGALAALCAMDLAESSSKYRISLCTFGSPRVGDPAFAAALRKRVRTRVRVFNTKDWVPDIPPPAFLGMRYTHAGRGFPVTFQRRIPLQNHSMKAYMEAMCRQSPAACKRICARDCIENFDRRHR